MDGVEQLERILPLLDAIVAGIGPDDLDRPTPCAALTVAGILDHMSDGAAAFAPAFRGVPSSGATATAGTTPDRWRAAMVDLGDAVHSPGARERTISSPFGDVPGSFFARYVAFDGLVHGWDLAVATGQIYEPPPEIVALVDEFARSLITPEMRDGDTFAAEVAPPDGASLLDRLVAFTGRTSP
jgi:uncharacterized protein (TIGR03086 family)